MHLSNKKLISRFSTEGKKKKSNRMFFIKIKRVTFRISGSYTLRTGLYHKTQFSNLNHYTIILITNVKKKWNFMKTQHCNYMQHQCLMA